MITIRPADQRGHADHGWLDSRFSFSFAEYYDPRHMGFRSLRVINDDHIAGGAGFPMHPHRDMEIVTYMLDGAIAHRDSMGNQAEIRPGEVQRMTAGTGITHSEFNPLPDDRSHLLQIWLIPRERGLKPSYDQKFFGDGDKQGKLLLVASPDGRDGSMRIEQEVSIYASRLNGDESVSHKLMPGRHGWIQVARGSVKLGDKQLNEGDGVQISDETDLVLSGGENSEFLLFDLN